MLGSHDRLCTELWKSVLDLPSRGQDPTVLHEYELSTNGSRSHGERSWHDST